MPSPETPRQIESQEFGENALAQSGEGHQGNRMNHFIDNCINSVIAKKNYAARVRGLAFAFIVYPQLALWARRISPALLA